MYNMINSALATQSYQEINKHVNLFKKLMTNMYGGSSTEQSTRMSTKPHTQALARINMFPFC